MSRARMLSIAAVFLGAASFATLWIFGTAFDAVALSLAAGAIGGVGALVVGALAALEVRRSGSEAGKVDGMLAYVGILCGFAAVVIVILTLLGPSIDSLSSSAGEAVATSAPVDVAAPPQAHERNAQIGPAESIAWSPSGDTLAVGGRSGVIALWDVQTGEWTRTLQAHEGGISPVMCLAWSPEATMLASGSSNIVVWDVPTGEQLQVLPASSGTRQGIAWSPDGTTLAYGTAGSAGRHDETIILWDVHSGEQVQALSGHTGVIWAVAWSPDGAVLASSSGDATIRLWGSGGEPLLSMGATTFDLREYAATSGGLSWSPDGKTIASAGGAGWDEQHRVVLWNTETGEALRTIETGGTRVSRVAWSPDGATLAYALEDDGIVLWSAESGEVTTSLEDPGDGTGVWDMAWSPNGAILAAVSGDVVILWNTGTGEQIRTLP